MRIPKKVSKIDREDEIVKSGRDALAKEIDNIEVSLTETQEAFLRESKVDATLPIDKWLKLTKKMARYDKYTDVLARIYFARARRLLLWGIVIQLVAIMASALLGPLAFLPLILFVFAFLQYQKSQRYMKYDINNYLRTVFVPIVSALRDKAGGQAKLSAQLDLRDLVKEKEFTQDVVRGRSRKLYQPNPIMLSTQLNDGTMVELAVQDDISHFTYRNARGKTKSKTKATHNYLIKLAAPKEKYPSPGDVNDPRITLEDRGEFYVAKYKGKLKTGVVMLDDDIILDNEAIFKAMQLLYDILLGKSHTDLRGDGEDNEDGLYNELAYMGMWYGYDDDMYYRSRNTYIYDDRYDREDYRDGFVAQGQGFRNDSDSVFDS
jgi:hypothetical protein